MYLSPREFHERFGCKYSESIFLSNEALRDQFKNDSTEAPTELQQKVIERLANPCTSVDVYDTGDSRVRYGCKANRDIPKGTCVFLYNGVLSDHQTDNKASAYRMGLTDELCMDSERVGNLMRFPSHLPTDIATFRSNVLENEGKRWGSLTNSQVEAERNKIINEDSFIRQVIDERSSYSALDYSDSIEFKNPGVKSELATANLCQRPVYIDGKPVIAVFTLCDIKNGDILGIDYGNEYWKSLSQAPLYMKKNGDIIASSDTRRNDAIPALQNKNEDEMRGEGVKEYKLGYSAFTEKKYHETFQHMPKAIQIFSHAKEKNTVELINLNFA